MSDIRLSLFANVPLPTAEVVRRLEREFQHVVVDRQRGVQYAAELMLDARRRGATTEADRLSDQLEEALEIIATDDDRSDDAFLKLFVVPGEHPVVRFFSNEHQRHSAALLRRCELALTSSTPKAE
jgi:hypothetical protein